MALAGGGTRWAREERGDPLRRPGSQAVLPVRGEGRRGAGGRRGWARRAIPAAGSPGEGAEVGERASRRGQSPPPARTPPAGQVTTLPRPGLPFVVAVVCLFPADGWMDALEIKFYFGKQTRPRPTSWVCSALPSHSSTSRRRQSVRRVSLAPPAPDPQSPPLPRRPSPTAGRAPAARTGAPAAPEAKVRRWGPLSPPVLASAQQGRRWPSFKGLLSAPHHRVIPPQVAGRA